MTAHAINVRSSARVRVLAGCTAVALGLAGLVAGLLSGLSSHPGLTHPGPAPTAETAAATNWISDLAQDLAPLSGSLVGLVQTADEWAAGQANAASVRQAITSALPAFAITLRNLGAHAPLPAAPSAKGDAVDAIALYVAAFRLELAATQVSPGALQHQLQRSFERIRELGDREYDLATTIANGGTPIPLPAGVTTARPADVPSWTALGLAAGPPLAATPPRAAPTPPTYQETRPQQPLAAWTDAVHTSSIPSMAAERQALSRANAIALGYLVDQVQVAVNRLDVTPDPDGMRWASTQIRLSLLVTAEGFRAAEAARLAGAPAAGPLAQEAQALAGIGTQMWDTGLPGHP